MKNIKKAAAICLLATVSYGAQAAELSIAYFMGPKHPMNKVPPKQYSILLDGVFALLMNKETYNDLSAIEKGWVDEASGAELLMNAGSAYMVAAAGGLKLAADSGLEMIELPASEKAQIEDLVTEAMVTIVKKEAGDKSIGEMIKILQGE